MYLFLYQVPHIVEVLHYVVYALCCLCVDENDTWSRQICNHYWYLEPITAVLNLTQ